MNSPYSIFWDVAKGKDKYSVCETIVVLFKTEVTEKKNIEMTQPFLKYYLKFN